MAAPEVTKFQDGGGSKAVLTYRRERERAKVQTFKTTVIKIRDHIAHNSAGLRNESLPWYTHKELEQLTPEIFLRVVHCWAGCGLTHEEYARRMSTIITEVHPEDLRFPGFDIFSEAQAARARWYADGNNRQYMEAMPTFVIDTPAVPAVPAVAAVPAVLAAGGNPAVPAVPAVAAVPAVEATWKRTFRMPGVQERADADAIDAKMSEADRKRFNRRPDFSYTDELRIAIQAIAFSPERIEMRRQLLEHLYGIVWALERPTVDSIYWRLFGAIHGKPPVEQTVAFSGITANDGEAMDAWSVRFFQEYDACKDWITTTQEALTVRFMLGVRRILPAVYDAVMSEFHNGGATAGAASRQRARPLAEVRPAGTL